VGHRLGRAGGSGLVGVDRDLDPAHAVMRRMRRVTPAAVQQYEKFYAGASFIIRSRLGRIPQDRG